MTTYAVAEQKPGMIDLNNMEIDTLIVLKNSGRAMTAKHIRNELKNAGWETIENTHDQFIHALSVLAFAKLIVFENPIDSYRITDSGREWIEDHMKNYGIPFAELVQRFCNRSEESEVA